MSEVKEKKAAAGAVPEAKKKKGKLPIIIALAVVLGSGGFFAMKMRGGPKQEAKVELGEMLEMEEFLTNLADKNTYVRTKIALHTTKGFKPELMAKNLPAIQDAINTELGRRTQGQIASLEGKALLRRSIAASVNKILVEAAGRDEPTAEEAEEAAPEEGQPTEPEAIPEGWDSAKGPVLKVYFVSFATQ